MIVVDFPETSENQVSLRVVGHSGQAAKGFDIVCSAVSALVQTFIGGLEEELEAQLQGEVGVGSCNLLIRVPEANAEKFRAVCKVFKYGFRKIAESYPEHVQLN